MKLKLTLIRVLTSIVLFTFMPLMNIWGSIETQMSLAIGYRSMLIFSVAMLVYFRSKAVFVSILTCVLGLLAMYLQLNVLTVLIFATGMAMSGYLTKYYLSADAQGAAHNKVALNVGSMVSGLFLYHGLSKNQIFSWSFGILSLALAIAASISTKEVVDSPKEHYRFKFSAISWSFLGISTGIKLTGVFTVLPQYLLSKFSELPNWYGGLMIFNGILVIVFQHKINNFFQHHGKIVGGLSTLLAMLLLSFPNLMKVELYVFALGWIGLLSIFECGISLYDVEAKKCGQLLPKELFVGVGSATAVYLSRSFPGEIYLTGLTGILCFFLFIALKWIEENLQLNNFERC